MVEMSDEQLLELYEAKGGNYVRDYMATTEEEALDNFPNILIITSPVTVSIYLLLALFIYHRSNLWSKLFEVRLSVRLCLLSFFLCVCPQPLALTFLI